MGFYDITLKDEVTCYNVEADSKEEAKEKVLEYWDCRKPSITIKERKKGKRTIRYSVTNYYKQDVLVDEDMNDDEIIELWDKDKIETLNDPVLTDEEYNEGSAWVFG